MERDALSYYCLVKLLYAVWLTFLWLLLLADNEATAMGKDSKNFKKWAARLPTWGKLLSHLGQAPCPKWARVVAKTVPKVSMERNVR